MSRHILRTVLIVASLFALAVGVSSAQESEIVVPDAILEAGGFTYGLEAQYRPFEFRDENNEIVGYDIDVANEVASRWGVTAEPVDTNWATVIQTLYDGGFDMILGGMTATEARYERVDFSVPYMFAGSGLLVSADSGIMDRTGLDGMRVGAGAGTPSIDQLEITAEELSIAYAGDIRTYDDDAAAYEAMRAGRIDAYASSIVSLNDFAQQVEGFEVIPFTSEMWGEEWTAAAFRKEDEALREAFNATILEMKADGTLAELQERWFGTTFDTSDIPPTWGEEAEMMAIAVPDAILEAGGFTYGLEAQYRPFEFRDENNEIVGYDIDVANEVASRWGVTAEPVDTNWATVIQTLYDGGFDMILGGMTATEARYERVDFSVPYMFAGSGLLVSADSGIMDRTGLDGMRVGAGAGTPSIDQLEITAEELSIAYAGDIRTYDDDAAAYEAMRAGRIDAYASSIVSLNDFAQQVEGFEVIPFTSEMWGEEWTAAAFRKEDEALREAFNATILEMKADGTLAELQERWFGTTFDTSDIPPTWE